VWTLSLYFKAMLNFKEYETNIMAMARAESCELIATGMDGIHKSRAEREWQGEVVTSF